MLHEQGDWDKLLAALARVPASVDGEPSIWKFRGGAKLRAGDLAGAAADYREAIERNPNVVDYHHRLALVEERLGLRDSAAGHRSRAAELREARRSCRRRFMTSSIPSQGPARRRRDPGFDPEVGVDLLDAGIHPRRHGLGPAGRRGVTRGPVARRIARRICGSNPPPGRIFNSVGHDFYPAGSFREVTPHVRLRSRDLARQPSRPDPGARVLGVADPDQWLDVTVKLRRKVPLPP